MGRVEFKPWIPLLIGIAPALGYAFAYVHELGYCGVYNIPPDFIRLDLTTILVAIAAALIGLVLLAWSLSLILSIPLYMSMIRKKVYFAFILLVFYGVFAFFYLTVEESKQLGIMLIFFMLIFFIGPWLSRKLPSKRKRQDIPLNRLIRNKYIQYSFIVGYMVFLLLSFGYLAGRSDAFQKEIFYVPSSNPELIVLKIYGDNIVCGKLVQQSGKTGLGPTINILRMENIDKVTFTPIKVKISFSLYPK